MYHTCMAHGRFERTIGQKCSLYESYVLNPPRGSLLRDPNTNFRIDYTLQGATTCSAARFRRRFWAAISALIGLGARAEHTAAPESGLELRKRFELCKRSKNGRVSHSRGVAQKLNLWPQTRGTVVASTYPTDWCAQKRLILPQQTRCALPVDF